MVESGLHIRTVSRRTYSTGFIANKLAKSKEDNQANELIIEMDFISKLTLPLLVSLIISLYVLIAEVLSRGKKD